jgi:hypothetical protein
MMVPIKVAGISPAFVARVAARGCQMQGLPEVQYHLHPPQARKLFEVGVKNMFAALESLGCVVLAPEELSPVIEVPEDPATDPR